MGFNSLVVAFIPEWWLLLTTTNQCSYNTDNQTLTLILTQTKNSNFTLLSLWKNCKTLLGL